MSAPPLVFGVDQMQPINFKLKSELETRGGQVAVSNDYRPHHSTGQTRYFLSASVKVMMWSFIKLLDLQAVPPESHAILFLLLLLPCLGSIHFPSSLII